MKFPIKLGAGAVLAVACASAYAIPPANVPAANRVYFGGATATDGVLENLFRLQVGGICQNGTIDIYRGTNQRAIFCTGVAPGLVGVPIGFWKESLGGSGNGTTPVADGTSLQFLDVYNPAFACTGGPTPIAGTATLFGYTERTGCTPSIAQVPPAGVADVEPRLLNASQSQINNLQTAGVLGIVFSPAVSLNLYRALQVAQGLTQNDLPANVPSLTSSQVRALYSGFYADWNQLLDDDAASGTPLPGAAGVTAPADTVVYNCRRGRSSGTQASFESYFLNQRCAPGVTGFVEPDDSACAASGCVWNSGTYLDDVIFAGSGTGDVRLCLDAHNDNNTWAIGTISTENLFNNTDRQFRYIRTDGTLPTLEETANGAYHFFTENVMNRRVGALSGVPLTLVNYMQSNLGRPALLTGINSGFQNTSGDGGVLAVPNFSTINPNAAPATVAELRANPVNGQTRGGNNCSAPLMTADSVVGGLPGETTAP